MESGSQSNSPKTEFYDQFTYMDSLTNRSQAVRDIRRNTKRQTTKVSTSRESEQQELRKLNSCISLLKNTLNLTKQESKGKVQEAIFDNSLSARSEGKDTIRKRRMVRNMLENTISERNKR